MYQLGWILTWVWLVLLFAGWMAHFVVMIHDAMTGKLKRHLGALENVPVKVATDHPESPGRVAPGGKR